MPAALVLGGAFLVGFLLGFAVGIAGTFLWAFLSVEEVQP